MIKDTKFITQVTIMIKSTTAQAIPKEDTHIHVSETKRPVVAEMEEILFDTLPVLDHGFVRVVDYMGDDNAIVQAARVSYGRGTKKKSQDQGLINYLMRHRHTTPFEMCDIKLHIKLPIFVARQWLRHRTASVNEYSARYSILDNEFYMPTHDKLSAQSTSNNQGRGKVLEGAEADRALYLLKRDAEQSYASYQEMLNLDENGNLMENDQQGLARELARMNLPVSYYTQMYWKINLHNLMHFLSLRADAHAQYEIQAYANVMLDIMKRWVPFAYEAMMAYRVNGAHISEKGLKAIKMMIQGDEVDPETLGMGAREWDEILTSLDLK